MPKHGANTMKMAVKKTVKHGEKEDKKGSWNRWGNMGALGIEVVAAHLGPSHGWVTAETNADGSSEKRRCFLLRKAA